MDSIIGLGSPLSLDLAGVLTEDKQKAVLYKDSFGYIAFLHGWKLVTVKPEKGLAFLTEKNSWFACRKLKPTLNRNNGALSTHCFIVSKTHFLCFLCEIKLSFFLFLKHKNFVWVFGGRKIFVKLTWGWGGCYPFSKDLKFIQVLLYINNTDTFLSLSGNCNWLMGVWLLD